ncbi:hypothetical protein BDF22DRAFT_741045 [Syncephalis plumigaleata]|nr:hypothetical protein BDF22DRAFT_741045 [Syncephalis plumigaleata]
MASSVSSRFEKELQRVNPSVMLPYWVGLVVGFAGSRVSQVFTESMFGGNGRENDTCLIDGQFANWQAIKALLVVSTNYDKFRRMLEAKPHAQVHNSVGGDFRTMYTANDPLFWLHHGFIDKLWADWQALRMSNARSYGGRDEKGVTAKISDIIAPFGYRVEEVFRTQDLCYEYGKMPVSQSDHNYDKMIGILTSPSILRNISICTGIEAIDQENLTTPILPDPHDREELVALRDTVPIPDDYIRMNHLNKKTVVEAEKLMRYFTQEINSNSDYVSPAALINRPEMLELIAQTHNILSITNGNIRTLFRASDFLDQKAVISRHLPECTP